MSIIGTAAIHNAELYIPTRAGDDAAESGEGDVDRMDAAPLPCVPSGHQVLRFLPVGHVLVYAFACHRDGWDEVMRTKVKFGITLGKLYISQINKLINLIS